MKPPDDPWDALGWFRFLEDWRSDWEYPGGLDFASFENRFVLSIVPDDWRKPGYGGTPGAYKDVGKGHAAFFQLFASGAFNEGQSTDLRPFIDNAVVALRERDLRFFPDFGQAFAMMTNYNLVNRKLIAPTSRTHEFMVLVTMLEDPEPSYTVSGLRRKVGKKFPGKSLTDKAVDKVMVRLNVRKRRRRRE